MVTFLLLTLGARATPVDAFAGVLYIAYNHISVEKIKTTLTIHLEILFVTP